MLQIDKVQQIQDVTVYGDDKNDFTFYLVPQTPRFRMEDGKPVFKFVKYRELRKEGNDLFGGVCAFDTEFVVAPDKLAAVKAELQKIVDNRYQQRGQQPPQIVIGPLTYTAGTANLNIGEGGTLVEKVRGAGKPSLYGNNVATFWVELTKAGATVFEQALQGQGGFVSVVYDLKIWAKLPAVTARGWWHASQFYAFVQEINTEENFWSEDSYEESIRETLRKREVMGTEFSFIGNPALSAADQLKMEQEIRAAVTRQLEDAVERNMLKEIEKTDPDTKSLREDQNIEDIKRTVSKTQVADVNISFKESQVIQWNIVPQGLLPNITTMKGPDGKAFNWKDYALEVDLNDPFFQTLEVSVRVNADFANLPIFNVEAKLSYPSGPDKPVQEYVFSSPDDVGKFRTFVTNNNRKYKFVYQVNYKGDSRVYSSEEAETDDTQLTINVDDLGILVVDIAPGDINFTQVKQAQLIVRYEDQGITPIERQFTLTPDKNSYQIREVIFKARTQPIRYSVKYFMTDGREYEVKDKEQDAPQIYINDPFSAMKTVGLRAVGDLNARIQSIMVDLVYKDTANNNYTQTKSMALSKATPFFDWTFPVIDENAGEVKYSGTIQYMDGTTQDIPETVAKRSTIQLGDMVADRLEIMVVPDLVDFTKVKLVNVSLHYIDSANQVDERKDLIFKAGEQAKNWVVDLKNKNAREYKWSARFFMADGTRREITEQPGQGETIILEVPV
ncbi:hypothetical protein [Candidatus Nitrotoga fabula]|uniref:Uncharacterized protein n=1 Tax=Candidatus Nitrotoga fabula TaxID=2182327 RepID=A0A916BEN6_9PROT|nr:hypothetical protein [Candidatus Nitrotoga fabula]CAE6729131.1 conserved hypothetical protein [Candidatus Nitrotoga fabula]